ncbi:MAG: HupE/UreJ family protein [Rhodospirillales bacterium]|nr:HupE/UreJ family protein [Rhodospirillales bacterium]
MVAAAAIALMPGIALAHTGVGDTSGFSHGFVHPLTGIDHLLAMMMVGVFAWQLGGRALWLVPLTFVMVMAIGGAFGVAGVSIPFVETGIALSVIVLGAAVAFRLSMPVAIAVALVGLFAVFHGHAHGEEMPENAAGLAYGLGFMLATAALHLAGIGLGFLIGRIADERGPAVVRITGGVAAVAGLALLGGLI